MADQNFSATAEALFKGMDAFLTTKTVVGEAVKFEDGTIVLPLVDVSFAVGAGAFVKSDGNNSGGAMTGKMSPSSVLVIQNGHTRLVNVKNQDTITKLLDMVPDVIDKFTQAPEEKQQNADIDAKAAEVFEQKESIQEEENQ